MAVPAVVESVFNTIIDQLADEVGALLGIPIELGNHKLQVIDKKQLFEIPRSRSVLTTMVVSGDESAEAYIITDLKDSVILGGTLIMLPNDQIEENCKQRTFEGEAADAYGEVANIIAGIFTSVFLDMYPANLHFKRTTVADFVPTQIDPASDKPFPPGAYVHSSCSMAIEGFELHNLEVIVPAPLLIKDEVQTDETATDEDDTPTPAPAADDQPPAAENSDNQPAEESEPLISKDTVDRVLRAAMEQCVEEVGAMLGLEMEMENFTSSYTSKKEFFAKPGKKTIATEMLVSGDSEGTAYFLTDLKDSIFFAGTLIMLPEDELNNHIKAGEFGEEEADAFGEVANIISGGLVQNFEEMYPRKFHLKKGEQEIFAPTKVKVEDPQPFPPGEYYLASISLDCSARELANMHFICPVELLHMEPRPDDSGWGAPAADSDEKTPPAADDTTSAAEVKPVATGDENATPALLVVADNEEERSHFISSLAEQEFELLALGTADNFTSSRQYQVLGAILILSDVDEQAFAAMIKIRSEIPEKAAMIVAGPRWTRSDVIKAVRYGASDIIVTPATSEEIVEKAATNFKAG